MKDFLIKLRFLKWMWITILITIISTIFFNIFIRLLGIQDIFIINFLFYSIAYSISLYYCIKVIKGQKRRIYEYNRLSKIFSKNKKNIKKSILYEMKYTKCEQAVANQLCEDYDINLK